MRVSVGIMIKVKVSLDLGCQVPNDLLKTTQKVFFLAMIMLRMYWECLSDPMSKPGFLDLHRSNNVAAFRTLGWSTVSYDPNTSSSFAWRTERCSRLQRSLLTSGSSAASRVSWLTRISKILDKWDVTEEVLIQDFIEIR